MSELREREGGSMLVQMGGVGYPVRVDGNRGVLMHQGSSSALVREAGEDVAIQKETVSTVTKSTPVFDGVVAWVDRNRWWVVGVMLGLYVLGFNGVWRPEPDSALYMTIGRNLAEGNGYTYQGKVDGLAYPGFPYLLAGIFKVFGAGSLFVPHLAVWLMTLATLGLTYAYFRLQASRGLALLVTFNVAVADTLYLCALQLRNDVPFLMGVMGFLTGYQAILRRSRGGEGEGKAVWGLRNQVIPWVLLCGGLAVAVAMRPTMLALVAAIVLAGIWSVCRGSVRKRYGVALLVVAAGVVAAFYALDPRASKGGHAGGEYEQVALNWVQSPGRFLERLVSPQIVEDFSRSTMQAMFGHELGLGVNTVVTAIVLGLGLWLVRKRPLWFFYLLATIGMMLVMAELDQPFQTGEVGQLVPRHFIGALPLLIYLWWRCAWWMEGNLPKQWGWVLVVVMGLVGLGPNIVKACETMTRQRVYAYRTWEGKSETTTIEQLGKIAHDGVEEQGTVVVPHKRGRQIAFYSGRRVIEATPVLKYAWLPKPVYVLEQSDESVKDFLHRNKLAMGPALAEAPGRIDWRGRHQRDWALHGVMKKVWPTTKAATKP